VISKSDSGEDVTFIKTGGTASQEFLKGTILPGIDQLDP
jgi:3-phosphoglycerate kinase